MAKIIPKSKYNRSEPFICTLSNAEIPIELNDEPIFLRLELSGLLHIILATENLLVPVGLPRVVLLPRTQPIKAPTSLSLMLRR
jgi:hypothetical protein